MLNYFWPYGLKRFTFLIVWKRKTGRKNLKFVIHNLKFRILWFRDINKKLPLNSLYFRNFCCFWVPARKIYFCNLFFCKYLVLFGDNQVFSTTKLCKNVYLELLFISSCVTVVLLTSMLLLKYQNYCKKNMVLCNIMHV